MLLDQALSVAISAGWIIFGVVAIIYLVRAAIVEGIGAALRKLFSRVFIVALLLLLVITLVDLALVFIEPQEVAVIVSLVTPEGYRDRPARSGLHWIVPLMEQVYRYPIYWQTYTMSGKPTEGPKLGDDSIAARTSDGQEVSLDCTVIFRIDPEQAIMVHIDWQSRYIEDFLRPLLRGVVRTQVSQYTVDEVNSSKRLDLEKDLLEAIKEAMEDKGFAMDSFLLRNIAFTPEYAASVELKQVALQEKLRKEHEAEQLRLYAAGERDRIKAIAEGDAQRIETVAVAEAQAIRVKAQAEADALNVIGNALSARPDLITYRYVEKLGTNMRVMLVPSDTPFLLQLPDLEGEGAGLSLEPTGPITPISPTVTVTGTTTAP